MRRIRLIPVIGLWLITFSSFAQVNSDSLIAVYSAKMKKYLDKDGKAAEVFSFTQEGIEVYVPATDTSLKKFEYMIFWNETRNFINLLTLASSDEALSYCVKKERNPLQDIFVCGTKDNRPGKKLLSNIRISLDPGHLAGDLETAKMEKKWVEMKNPPVTLIEGELTLATALLLKKKLEAEGALVMLTRDTAAISAFGIDFDKWMDSLFIKSVDEAYAREDVSFEEKNYLLTKATNLEIFRRFFLFEDVRERARKINAFKPDITLMIHYNVDETNTNWNKPTKKNFNMAFVGGSFNGEEYSRPEDRIEFLRLLFTDEIERSVEFSKYMMQSLVATTKVPAALDSNAVYLKDNCMKTDAGGVFCRNLTLTRKVKGVICYGESLYQDNVNECKLLSKKEVKVGDIETSKRVEEVANAYFEGVLNYIKHKSK